MDRHAEDIMLETATCKLFCSEGSWQVIDDALQIWGGERYMRENRLERALRDARINRIVEGASDVMTAPSRTLPCRFPVGDPGRTSSRRG